MQPSSSPTKPPSAASRRRAATLVFIAVALTAACGGNDEGASPGAQPSTASSTVQSPSAPPAVAFTAPPPGADPCEVTPPALPKQVLGAGAKQQRITSGPVKECIYTADENEKELAVGVYTEPVTQETLDQDIADDNSDPRRTPRHRCELVAGIGTSAHFCPALITGDNSFRVSELDVLAGQTGLIVRVRLSQEPQEALTPREREAAILVAKQALQQA